MPEGWKIKVNFTDDRIIDDYQITRGEEVFTIGRLGECKPPDGWEVKFIWQRFYAEITIIAPDGVRVMIDDSYLA